MKQTIQQEHLERFSKSLRPILENELMMGNEITETFIGWWDDNAICISLKFSFKVEYRIDRIEYREVNDYHYWKSEYEDPATQHLLICGFDKPYI